ncbi:MAG: hypothetical protein Q9218_006350 [Villophora microphyllina]
MNSSHIRAEDLQEAKQLVRTFSWKTYSESPDDDLVQSLVLAEAIDTSNEKDEGTLGKQWGEIFDPLINETSNQSHEEIILATPTDELAKAYKAFQKCLPKEHEDNVADGPPKIKAVAEAVAIADSAWKKNRECTKAGRMKTLFGKVCGSLNNHKNLFAVLPSGDKYVCLVTGSISAIVKIAEGVSKALDDLSDDVEYWRDLLRVYQGHVRMKEYVVRLYVVVFKFLVNIMTKWSKSSVTRFLRSFDSNFFKDEIEMKQVEIRDLVRRLEREGSLAMQDRVLQAPTLDDIAAIVSSSQAKFRLEWFSNTERIRRELGQTVKDGLEEGFLNLRWAQRDAIQLGPNPRRLQLGCTTSISDAPEHAGGYYLKEQIALAARRRLQQTTHRKHVSTSFAQCQDLSVHIEIFDKVQQWNGASGSQLLWVQGPFQAPTPSRYTLLSTYVLGTAQRASIPTAAYFCDTDTDMVGMVYSLILQVVELIPEDFHSSLDFTSGRFEALDGTGDSLTDAIYLFKDLLDVGPYLLFIVIDGLQRLDTASNAGTIDKLAGVLCSVGRCVGGGSQRTVKILLTTDGIVESLMSLRGDERLDVLDFTGEEDGSVEVDGMELGFL